MAVDTVNEMGKCVQDKLLSPKVVKIDGIGEEEWIFAIPPDQPNSMDNSKQRDWYCFDCHQAGFLYSCRTCFRSYHTDCIKQVNDQVKGN